MSQARHADLLLDLVALCSYVQAGHTLEKLLAMGPPAEELAAVATSSGLLSNAWCMGSGSSSADCKTSAECPDSFTVSAHVRAVGHIHVEVACSLLWLLPWLVAWMPWL